MMLLIFAAPIGIIALVLAVPVAYRYLWPLSVKRPQLFLRTTLTIGVAVAVVAISWFLNVLVGIGITGISRATDASKAAFEVVLRNRLLVAAVFAVLVEYLICRITQTVMDMY
jgi:hypothetical protein